MFNLKPINLSRSQNSNRLEQPAHEAIRQASQSIALT
jgi:hypothetical protein